MKEKAGAKVYLVGAGPGDPLLITVKGLRCIGDAGVIVYDRLVDDRLLAGARPEAEKIYVGKSSHGHTMSQAEINELLINKSREGKIVVRLKGGDPFIFGRGGEEAEALAARGIPFEVVPGVSAATAVPAYAGIPVTHRGLSSSLTIVTGHEDPAKEISSIDWDRLAAATDTLVFLMGMGNLAQIAEQLISKGRPPTTPVALIREGTGPRQQTVTGTLADIADKASRHNLTPPVVIVIGDVVVLRDKLRWFDNQPIFSKRVLVTRASHQAGRLSELLSAQGAEPVELPAIAIQAMPDYNEIDKALAALSDFDWIVFTSANGVDAFFNRLQEHKLDARELKGIQVCAIGPATAGALEERGVIADYLPREYISEGIIEGFADKDIRGKRFLLPRAEQSRPVLVEGLEHLGAHVVEIHFYRTTQPPESDSRGRQMLLDGEIDITTFTSSSTVRNLASLLGEDWQSVNNTTVACIGPVTADTAAEAGLRVDVVAGEHTIPGLVQAIVEKYQ